MANYDFTDKSQTYAAMAAEVTQEDNRVVVMRNVVDFAEQNLSATDTAYVMDIPANTLVLAAGVFVLTADASAQIDLGDTTTATQFLTNSDISAAGTVDISSDFQVAAYYATADHLVVTDDVGLDTSKCEFFMVCLPLNIDNKVKKPMQN